MIRMRRLLAKSWILSQIYYRVRGIRLTGRAAEDVWYFAFGANMHDSAFRERRGMRPREWRPGRVRGYRLRFNLEGRPRGRAAPANVAPDPQGEVWGVLYRISRADLVRLDWTEGGARTPLPPPLGGGAGPRGKADSRRHLHRRGP